MEAQLKTKTKATLEIEIANSNSNKNKNKNKNETWIEWWRPKSYQLMEDEIETWWMKVEMNRNVRVQVESRQSIFSFLNTSVFHLLPISLLFLIHHFYLY